ncbi:MAG: hypothetical protein R3C28_33645 [Pirellulaceae bacterium]
MFTGIVFAAVNASTKDLSTAIYTTAGSISGPFVGAIARHFQNCCFAASLHIAIRCGPILIFGIAAQFLPFGHLRWGRTLQYLAWSTGWLLWFGGGLLSFGHALS